MKKVLFSLNGIVMIGALILSACASKASPTASSAGGPPSANGGAGAGFANQPLPLAAQLVVGTFKLEGTANAVDAKEAANLVPLWQSYTQLISSNTADPAQIDAVVSQIQSTMTPQQVQAITAMNLTTQDEFTTMSSLGLGGFRGGANGTLGFGATPRAGGGGGGFSGGGAGGGGTRPTPDATQRAARAQVGNRIPTALMNALISLLQKEAPPSS
ncbi:MAG: hypothetical protein ABSB61_07640 [Anaerolineales bacterium]|jgi:hypothetical protein